MTYSRAVEFLDSLVNYEKLAGPRNEFKLDNIRRLLELAGNPERRMRNVILVAGTKGKGSVCYMLEAALRGCKLSTGMFVSPHVIDVRERIQLDGKPIPKSLFADLVSRLAPFVAPSEPNLQTATCKLETRAAVSYFELTTAMAFLLFAEMQHDYSIVEVGLGGRLDATNLSDPVISVITRIGYDHLKVLGDTLTKIAGEKAGDNAQGKARCHRRTGARGLRGAQAQSARVRCALGSGRLRCIRPIRPIGRIRPEARRALSVRRWRDSPAAARVSPGGKRQDRSSCAQRAIAG